jgi:acyl-CoA reductase-like NAD-dependent aldehyde dehydrogenase
MVITKEETFGPVALLYRFKTEEDEVKMANDTEFGCVSASGRDPTHKLAQDRRGSSWQR